MRNAASLNPYKGRPDYTFWRRAVSALGERADPITNPKFAISPADAVATAGSCFSQRISKTLVDKGFNFLVTERHDQFAEGTTDESYGIFPARYGNIYTPRQLRQLFERSYGLANPTDELWTTVDGKILDPFRPNIQTEGFPTEEALHADRERHLAATRKMFEDCDVFFFTLGMTEAWVNETDGMVVPLAPGVVDVPETRSPYIFKNFSFSEVVDDLSLFLQRFRAVNPSAKIMLTVSPVSIIATFENRHVMVSNIASKCTLRAAVEEVIRQNHDIDYFPGFEIVAGPSSRGMFYEEELREVSEQGIQTVMSIFRKHYLSGGSEAGTELTDEDEALYAELSAVICDEDLIAK